MGKHSPDLLKTYVDTSHWPYITEENIEGPDSGCNPFRPAGCAYYGCFIPICVLLIAVILSFPFWILQDVLHLIKVY